MARVKPFSMVRACVALAFLCTLTDFAAAAESPAAESPAAEPPAAESPVATAEADADDPAASAEAKSTDDVETRKSAASPGSPSGYTWRSMSDEELAYELERNSLGGPIALTVVGGVFSGLFLPTFMMSGIGAAVCHSGVGQSGTTADCTVFDAVALVSGVATAGFGTMTVVGIVMLDRRSSKRRGIKNELSRRQQEGASLKLGLTPVPGGSLLAIGGQF